MPCHSERSEESLTRCARLFGRWGTLPQSDMKLEHHHLRFGFFERIIGDLLLERLARQHWDF